MAEALAERCRAGVGVNLLLDAVGSSHMPGPLKDTLRDSGCHWRQTRSSTARWPPG